jgi:hypothetical protein
MKNAMLFIVSLFFSAATWKISDIKAGLRYQTKT